MSRIFWDTQLFLYLIEDRERAGPVAALRGWMVERGDVLLASALTLGEILTAPVAAGDAVLARRYEYAIGAAATLLPFDAAAARHFAEIRRDRSIREADAIQLSCAAAAGTDLFVASDDRLSRMNIRGIHFIQSLDRAVP